jgi:teichuronic acid biosynthesis glycosyltransferase TuaG
MPTISIITPSYNAAKTLNETAQSVLAQRFTDWEWLIANDASRDDTAQMLNALAAQDKRIKPIYLEKNGGPAVARQAALAQGSGAFIAFLDADDVWLPEKLEKQIAFMNEKNAALSYTAFRRMNEDSTHVGRFVSVPTQLNYNQLLSNTAIVCSSAMINRTISGPFTIKNNDYDDFTTWLDILKRGHVAYGLNDDMVRYRVRACSDSSNKAKAIARVWNIYRNVEKLPLIKSMTALGGYGWNAVIKRLGF